MCKKEEGLTLLADFGCRCGGFGSSRPPCRARHVFDHHALPRGGARRGGGRRRRSRRLLPRRASHVAAHGRGVRRHRRVHKRDARGARTPPEAGDGERSGRWREAERRATACARERRLVRLCACDVLHVRVLLFVVLRVRVGLWVSLASLSLHGRVSTHTPYVNMVPPFTEHMLMRLSICCCGFTGTYARAERLRGALAARVCGAVECAGGGALQDAQKLTLTWGRLFELKTRSSRLRRGTLYSVRR